MKNWLFLSFLLLSSVGKAQDDNESFEKKYFLIAASTADYDKAKSVAQILSDSLCIKLNLRDLLPADGGGLTWNEQDCENEGWEFPCYVARGRWDDGAWISIEWSEAFSGFKPGYYVVIVHSSSEKDVSMNKTLQRVKKLIPKAYIKSSSVYIGCLH